MRFTTRETLLMRPTHQRGNRMSPGYGPTKTRNFLKSRPFHSDKSKMEVNGLRNAGNALTRNAQARADDAARKLVADPGDLNSIVEVGIAEDEAKVGARLLKAHDDMTGTLLDVLA